MMYATARDFEDAFGLQEAIELTNLDNPAATEVDPIVMDTALIDATAEIDTYLRAAGYTLPLSTPPSILLGRCLDIARYRLDRIRTRPEVRERYLDALKWLRDLAMGNVSLDLPDAGAGAGNARAIFYTGTTRAFTQESLWDYR